MQENKTFCNSQHDVTTEYSMFVFRNNRLSYIRNDLSTPFRMSHIKLFFLVGPQISSTNIVGKKDTHLDLKDLKSLQGT